PRGEFPEGALEVLAAVFEITVEREAVRHQIVGRFVAVDAARCAPEVDGNGEPAVDGQDHDRGNPADETAGRPGADVHARPLSVRNASSGSAATSRRRGRDSRASTSYRRSIFRTKLLMSYASAVARAPAASRSRSTGSSMSLMRPRASAAASRLGTTTAFSSWRSTSASPSASVATIGREAAMASNTVSGVP